MALFLGGYLCRHGFAGGWPSIFYVFGISGFIWCFLWLLLVTDSPHTNRWVSQEEKNYIEQSLKEAIGNEKVRNTFPEPLLAVNSLFPCRFIMCLGEVSSLPFLFGLPPLPMRALLAQITQHLHSFQRICEKFLVSRLPRQATFQADINCHSSHVLYTHRYLNNPFSFAEWLAICDSVYH